MSRIHTLAAFLCVSALRAAEPNGIEAALQRMYNQDYVAAHEILDRYIATNPRDPLPFAFQASAYLFFELDRLSILESEFLTDDKQIAEKKKKLDPDPLNREKFVRAVHDVETRADAALKINPDDPQALFAMCIAQGVATDYMAFVEKKQFSSLSVAKRSNSYAQRLLKLDPKFYDAYLTAGISEYMIGSLPFFIKWFVHFDNVDGSKDRGVDRLRLVAREGHYFKPFSKIMLSIIALRDKRPQEAQQWLTELARDYPENRLFHKELAKVNAKLGINAN
jgi:tetratricopeptide (TPR) repeat protein